MAAEEEDDTPYQKKPRPPEDTEIDITPMIDVTFQLLIFFMVTSTMQGNPPAIVPRSMSGGSTELAKVAFKLVIKAPVEKNTDPVMEIDKKPITMEEPRTAERGSRSSSERHRPDDYGGSIGTQSIHR